MHSEQGETRAKARTEEPLERADGAMQEGEVQDGRKRRDDKQEKEVDAPCTMLRLTEPGPLCMSNLRSRREVSSASINSENSNGGAPRERPCRSRP